MSNKRTKHSSKNDILKNQTVLSKYFVTSSDYPTSSLLKRNIQTPNSPSESPQRKIPKLTDASYQENSEDFPSKIATTSLQSFAFQKEKKKENQTLLASESCIEEESDLNSYCETDSNACPIAETTCYTNTSSSKKDTVKYTALEKQYIQFRDTYPDTVLLIECGYKYRFFGKDAEIVSKVCNIGCYQNRNFLSATVPVHRLHFYVKELVKKDFKVGVIKQTESAALKAASENRNELFARHLHALYTKSTLIGEEFITATSEDLQNSDDASVETDSGYLVTIHETPPNAANSQAHSIVLVGVQVSSGNIVHASFQDSLLRNNLETHLLHMNPAEILVPQHLSKETEKLLMCFSNERFVRLEKIPECPVTASTSLNHVLNFYMPANLDQDNMEFQDIRQIVLSLPESTLHCISALITYLSQFKLESSLNSLKDMKSFRTLENMTLTSTTLKGLEILWSLSDNSEKGSLFWTLNKTLTKFGERLLRLWTAKPLKDVSMIEERLNIVTEFIYSESIVFKVLDKTLVKLPDLERILSCIFYRKCSCFDFLKLLQAFAKIKCDLLSVSEKVSSEVSDSRLKLILTNIPELFEDTETFLKNLHPEAAKDEDKTRVFNDISIYPEMQKCRDEILSAENQLNNLRPEICKKLKMINFKYVTVAGHKYLIEVQNSHLSLVPTEWLKISSTKQVSRYKSPEILKLCKKIEQQNELMIGHANDAWTSFMNTFADNFYKYKRAISHLAELDCYLSLAKVAKEENYCRPNISVSEDTIFTIKQGQHPMAVKILGEENQFIANDIELTNSCRSMIITGPNMGGKSTYIRQTAIIAIMAHMGSYVPAESATIPLFDSIYVRMGSDDALTQGKSTFMVEMCETSHILNNATSKSFVILDEVGRGTSTNDGTAVAYATLKYLIEDIRCFTMFVTHYPPVVELKDEFPDEVTVVHMGYILKEAAEDADIETVTFLYNVVPGVSKKSYGINVAALAGIPKDLLVKAQQKSREVEFKYTIQRKIRNLVESITKANS